MILENELFFINTQNPCIAIDTNNFVKKRKLKRTFYIHNYWSILVYILTATQYHKKSAKQENYTKYETSEIPCFYYCYKKVAKI